MVTDGNVIGAGREVLLSDGHEVLLSAEQEVLLSAGLNVLSSPVQNPSITNTRENTNAGMLCAESVTCSHDTHL